MNIRGLITRRVYETSKTREKKTSVSYKQEICRYIKSVIWFEIFPVFSRRFAEQNFLKVREEVVFFDSYGNNLLTQRRNVRGFYWLGNGGRAFFRFVKFISLSWNKKTDVPRPEGIDSGGIHIRVAWRKFPSPVRNLACSFSIKRASQEGGAAFYHKYLRRVNAAAIFRALVICAARNQYFARGVKEYFCQSWKILQNNRCRYNHRQFVS